MKPYERISEILGRRVKPVMTVPDGAQAGDLIIEPFTYKAGAVEYAADCGTLVARENRCDPASRLIALPVTRIRATGSNAAEPIFCLSGGPGFSNMEFTRVPWFIEDRDVVLVGYRGVDGSVVLDGPEVGEHIKNLPGKLLSAASIDTWAAALTRCAERLQSEGVDLDGYSVVEVVDDVESARVALGYERVNLYSVSYGTRLAMIYAWRYPESVYRSAMVAVNPPGYMFYYDPAVIDEQLEHYAGLCAQDPKCSARTDNLAETIRTVSRTMPERWLGLPIDADMVRMACFESLNTTQAAALVFDVWLAAAKGDYSGMVLLTLLGPRMFAQATLWGENIAKAANADDELTRDLRAAMNLSDSILGSPRSELVAVAKGWPVNTIPAEYCQVQPSDVETLLLSGNVDFWTPLQFAEDELLPHLSKGQHVVVSESGHGEMLRRQPEASRRLLSSFYETGVGDDSLFTYQPWDFHVRLGFPAMAKLIVAAIALVVAGMLALLWFVIHLLQNQSRVSPAPKSTSD